ncbi:MAG: hypothetical protein JWM34_3192 [Ilumatobacteraceae bacterium]|nr:hypothetical protein [Ilumatobacteraceae bacterium]
MRRTPRLCLLAVSALATVALVAACSSDTSTTTPPSVTGLSIATGSTAPIPGSCDPDAERIPAPSIIIGGTSTDATFGVGAYECGTITGDGYIVFSFNPVLLDASGPVEIKTNSADVATITWDLGTFTQSNDGVWTSTAPTTGCARLTIDLVSPAGLNTATYGADVRVGGTGVDCPQRVIDPTDPGDIGSVVPATPAASYDTLPPVGTFGTIDGVPDTATIAS